MKIVFQKCLSVFIMGLFCSIFVSTSFATEDEENISQDFFKKGVEYDLYLNQSKHNQLLIKHVSIQDIVTIGGVTFLVIHSEKQGFSLKQENGFIVLKSVSAILPHDKFRVTSFHSKKKR